jgi:hypothetical protein
MSELPGQQPDSLDELLMPSVDPVGDAFRRDVFARTTSVLRRRRRAVQLARLTGLAACFVAGLLLMRELPLERLPPPPRPVPPPPITEPTSASALEWEAIDHPERAAPLYRAAGDRYLTKDADPEAAARCYGSALSAGSSEDLTIDPNDSWLMMAIKDARQKEARDANRLQ